MTARAITLLVVGALVASVASGTARAEEPEPAPRSPVVNIFINPPPNIPPGPPPAIGVEMLTGQVQIEGIRPVDVAPQCLVFKDSTGAMSGTNGLCIGTPYGPQETFHITSYTDAFPFVTGGKDAEAALSWIVDEAVVVLSGLYGVPTDYRIERYGRGEIRAYVVERLTGIVDKAAYGLELSEQEQVSLDYLQREILDHDATLATASYREYERFTTNPCAYVPPPTPAWVASPVGVPDNVVTACAQSKIGLAAAFAPPVPSVEHFQTWGLYTASQDLGLDVLAEPAMQKISTGVIRGAVMLGAIGAAVATGLLISTLAGTSFALVAPVAAVVGSAGALTLITAGQASIAGGGAGLAAATKAGLAAWAGAVSGATIGILLVALAAIGLSIWDLHERAQIGSTITNRMNAALEATDPFGLAALRTSNAGRDLDADLATWDDPALRPSYRSAEWTGRITDLVARSTAVLPDGEVRPDPTDLWEDHATRVEDEAFVIDGHRVASIEVPVALDDEEVLEGAETAEVWFNRSWPIVDGHPSLTFTYLDTAGDLVLAARMPDRDELLLTTVASDAEEPQADRISPCIEYLDPDDGEPVEACLDVPETEPRGGPHPVVTGMMVPGRVHNLVPNPAFHDGTFDPDEFVDDFTYTWTVRRFDPNAAGGAGAWVDVPITPEAYQGNPTYTGRFTPPAVGQYQATVQMKHHSLAALDAAGAVEFDVKPPAIELATLELTDDPVDGELDLEIVADQTSPVTDMQVTVRWPGEIGDDADHARPEVTYDLTQCSGTACAAHLSWPVTPLTDFRHQVTVTVANSYGSSVTRTLPIVTPNRPTLAPPPPPSPGERAVIDFDPHVTHVQLPVAVPGAPRNHTLATIVPGDALPGDGDPAFSLRDPVTGQTAPGFDVLQLLVADLGPGVLTASIDQTDDGPVVALNANVGPEHVGSYEVPLIVEQFGRHNTVVLRFDVVAAPDDMFRAGVFSDDVTPLDFGVDDVPDLVPGVVGGREEWGPYDGELCLNISTGGTYRELCDHIDAFFDDEGDPLPFPYRRLVPHGLDAGRFEVGATLPDGERTFAEPIQLVFMMDTGPPVIQELSWDEDEGVASIEVLSGWPPGVAGPDLDEITCRLDGVELDSCFEPVTGTGTWTPDPATAPMTPGSHVLEVLVTNVRGNYDTATLGFTVAGSTATLRGAVRDASGEPIGGARVALIDSSGRIVHAKNSRKNGRFNFDDIEPGTYRVVASRGGYLTGWYEGDGTFATATPLEVTSGLNTSILMVLEQKTFVEGVVTRSDGGSVVKGVKVTAYDAVTGAAIAADTTDGNGRYTFSTLPIGSYRVFLRQTPSTRGSWAGGGGQTAVTAVPIPVAGGRTTIDAVVDPKP